LTGRPVFGLVIRPVVFVIVVEVDEIAETRC